ncbi:TPA: N-6 DNA methylase [Enterobacter hormaechei]|uniref:N-6 DNA methylase n=1 Tax=Enterobacter hormaechei TaxID=158836 RepID=UPI000A42D4FA|nr:N-6 DNA methylase [Enterobacter hormaechei]
MGKTISRKKRLSQYYTNREVAEMLISSLPSDEAKKIIDLSAGEGSLLSTAIVKYKSAKLYGFDIDDENCRKLECLKNTTSICLDATHSASFDKIKDLNSTYDIVIGNPPFYRSEHTDFSRRLFNEWSLNHKSKYYRTEILFLILSLKLLDQEGSCGIVVPDTVISSDKYKPLREKIASSFKFISIIELDSKSFLGTEARTHILTVSNKINIKPSIKTRSSKKNKAIILNETEFIERADHQYNSFKYNHSEKTIENSGIKVLRGNLSKRKNTQLHDTIIHSSSFYNDYSQFENDNTVAENGTAIQAVKGDVVVPRVGTRCLGKVGIIRNGSFTITDCVFVIKSSEYECGEMIAKALKSKFGVEWIKSISKGIGAQYITLNDIKKLPLR